MATFFFQWRRNLKKRKTRPHPDLSGRSLCGRRGRWVPKELLKHILGSFLETSQFISFVSSFLLRLGKSLTLYLELGFQRTNNPVVLIWTGLTSSTFVGSPAIKHV